MARWTQQQVNDAAPDAASLSAARKLAKPGPWGETGCNEALVWGQCQGSGKKPYQVSVDLLGPAYRCSCPSRKFPCKHALALLMLWSEGVLDESGQVAEFTGQWAAERAGRAAATSARATAPAKPVDEQARAKRLAERLERMDGGVADLRLWLEDLVRTGLAAARRQGYGFWDAAAARLVDAHLPGLAERVRGLGGLAGRESWAEAMLAEIGRLWAVTAAWERRAELTPGEQADVRVAVGWAVPSSEVRDADSVRGRWTVLGVHRTDDGTILQQRTWLRHEEGEFVQVLDFAGYGQSLAVPQLAGAVLDADLARYPGDSPRRALFVDPPQALATAVAAPVVGTVSGLLDEAAAMLATAPWRTRVPALLGGVSVERDPAGGWSVVDGDGASLPLVAGPTVWSLLALTGGAAADVFGEWDDGVFRPLTVWVDGEVHPL